MMDNMDVLVHVSFSEIKAFKPRVPKWRAPRENGKTPRICFCTNKENCLTSMPGGGRALRGLLKIARRVTPVLHVYHCIPWENQHVRFIPPQRVQKKYHVPDAIACGEWWALDTPAITHIIIRVDDAEMVDATDVNGKPGVLVKRLNYETLDSLPENSPERFFAQKGLKENDVRKLLEYVDQITTVK